MTTQTNLWADMVAERVGATGPTGEFVEALEVAVVDNGGNEYGRGTTSREVAAIRDSLRISTRLRVLRTGQPAVGGELYCGFCE